MTSTAAHDSAMTTIAQLAGNANKLRAMIGVKQVGYDANSVTFKFAARATNGANCCTIVLDASDTYTVKFHSIRGLKCTPKGETSDVYADSLRTVFEQSTGLRLSL